MVPVLRLFDSFSSFLHSNPLHLYHLLLFQVSIVTQMMSQYELYFLLITMNIICHNFYL